MRKRPQSPRNLPILRLVILLVLFLACGPAAFAQGGGGGATLGNRGTGPSHTIRGKLFLPSGNPPEQRIRVVLEINIGGIAGETFSDSVGNFEFRSIPNGVYKITIPSDGRSYEMTQEVVELSGGFSRTVAAAIYLRDKVTDPGARPRERVLTPADIQDVPKDAKKIYEKGLKRSSENKFEEAAGLFEQALKIFPDFLNALNKLGEQKALMGRPEEAQAAYEKAIAVNERFALPYINLGILHVMHQRFDDAVPVLDQGNKLDDTYPMGHLNLGLALMSKKEPDYDRAEKELQRALSLGKGNLVAVHKYIYNIHYRRRAWDKAAGQLEAYLKEAPDAPDAPQVRGMLDRLKKMVAGQAGTAKN
jgi:Flp pilus assembly protein TadD